MYPDLTVLTAVYEISVAVHFIEYGTQLFKLLSRMVILLIDIAQRSLYGGLCRIRSLRAVRDGNRDLGGVIIFGNYFIRLVRELTENELKTESEEKIEIITDDSGLAVSVLEKENITNFTVVDSNKIHVYQVATSVADLNKKLVTAGVNVEGIHVIGSSLENFYLSCVDKGGNKNDNSSSSSRSRSSSFGRARDHRNISSEQN